MSHASGTGSETQAEVDGLVRASGMTLTDEERAALTALYARFAGDRAALSKVELGETEPAVTFDVRSA